MRSETCGALNWSKQHDCPARAKKRAKRGKPGHVAKCLRSRRKGTNIAEETYNAQEDDSTPDRTHSIQQKIHSLGQTKRTDLLWAASLLEIRHS